MIRQNANLKKKIRKQLTILTSYFLVILGFPAINVLAFEHIQRVCICKKLAHVI